MRASRSKLLGVPIAAAATAAIAVLPGCDLQETADTENGRTLFVEKCGTCHAFKEAGTQAEVGPDLDAAFAAARKTGMDSDTIEGVVESQIGNPRFEDPDSPAYMPANLVEGEDAADVAAYVAEYAGVPGVEPPIPPDAGPGAEVFLTQGCGSCHTLAELGDVATGTVGPNLDEVIPGQTPKEVEQSIVDPDAKIEQGFSSGRHARHLRPGPDAEGAPGPVGVHRRGGRQPRRRTVKRADRDSPVAIRPSPATGTIWYVRTQRMLQRADRQAVATDGASAARTAAATVEAVQGKTYDRFRLAADFYRGGHATGERRRYGLAELSFLHWEIARGVLAPPAVDGGGSPWWRAINDELLRDKVEADRLAAGSGDEPLVADRRAVARVHRRPVRGNLVSRSQRQRRRRLPEA